MSVRITTLYSGNETSASVSSSVNCFLLDGNPASEIVRTVDNLTEWTTIRVSFKACLVGSPATGNFNAYMWFGLCSGTAGRFLGPAATEHNVGYMVNTSGGTVRTGALPTWTAVTNANTNPANQNICAGAVIWPSYWTTGSGAGASGTGGYQLPRYETQYSSSWQYHRIVGQCFQPINIFLVKGSPTWAIQSNIYNNFPTGEGCLLGIPHGWYERHLQEQNTSGVTVMNTAWQNETGYAYIPNRNHTNTITAARINEDIYGPLDSFNLYFTASAGVQLAVKDIYVVRIV